MLEKIEKALGTELAQQVTEALKKAELEIGVTNDGSLVPAGKYDDLKREKSNLQSEYDATKTEVGKLQSQIKSLGDSDATEVEKLKAQLKEANDKYTEFESEVQNRETTRTKISALSKKLVAEGANPEAVDLLVEKFNVDDITLDSKEEIVDWEKHFTPIKEARKSLFGETSYSGGEPGKGQPDATPDASAYQERLDSAKTNLERVKIRQEAWEKGVKI